uniref:Uncharacterized protein n=1 Tax=Arundo donax TaxID=35708 RepID=A0A0A9GWY9_ARUDO
MFTSNKGIEKYNALKQMAKKKPGNHVQQPNVASDAAQ